MTKSALDGDQIVGKKCVKNLHFYSIGNGIVVLAKGLNFGRAFLDAASWANEKWNMSFEIENY